MFYTAKVIFFIVIWLTLWRVKFKINKGQTKKFGKALAIVFMIQYTINHEMGILFDNFR